MTWHEDRWDDAESRFLAFTLHDTAGADGGESGHGALYAAFNAHGHAVAVDLPAPPPGRRWARVVDTNLPAPRDFVPGGNAGVEARYTLTAHSAILLLAKPL